MTIKNPCIHSVRSLVAKRRFIKTLPIQVSSQWLKYTLKPEFGNPLPILAEAGFLSHYS